MLEGGAAREVLVGAGRGRVLREVLEDGEGRGRDWRYRYCRRHYHRL